MKSAGANTNWSRRSAAQTQMFAALEEGLIAHTTTQPLMSFAALPGLPPARVVLFGGRPDDAYVDRVYIVQTNKSCAVFSQWPIWMLIRAAVQQRLFNNSGIIFDEEVDEFTLVREEFTLSRKTNREWFHSMCKVRECCKFYLHDLFELQEDFIGEDLTKLAVRAYDGVDKHNARFGLGQFGTVGERYLLMQHGHTSREYDISFCSVIVILWKRYGEPERISSVSIEDPLDSLVVRIRTHSSSDESCAHALHDKRPQLRPFLVAEHYDELKLQPLLGGAEEELCDGRVVEWSGERLQGTRVFANDEILQTERGTTAAFVITAHDLQRRLKHDELHEDPLAWDAPASEICKRAFTLFPEHTHITCYASNYQNVCITMNALQTAVTITEHDELAACDMASIAV
jgi:hypothetical protein